ncbi:hypothetical protein [Bacillus thuringiensis]|uniref:hypothetical protein n=1 Tax=Bacillus thuringiensis TaxID=1428 RepID=UPI001592BAD2|nr:hypothetical protein [Bacillus thuringiensis]
MSDRTGGRGTGVNNGSQSIKPATTITVTRGINGNVTSGPKNNGNTGNSKQGK